ncbi:hypothetical protein SSABA_v1c03900 [Spiroplasma sabaudiense Ar-1343]|uniref:Lipoprotein n=1 Tax=Spiroplasma sabaudiense Ar-1343 TaxID=1276257 RepID=W6AJA4_9MOLU|nr:hypothetical protein [Spiroplasma sabaudiense]AHI53799.1 hypothetical protein SSABA_v1c03900 [Spiroplasma sabaudiense Ar-1343]
MKKLLTILATSSLIVSAPLSVVACKRTNNKPSVGGEFDFEVAKREALSLISTITSSHLRSDLSKYYFIDEQEEPNLGLEFLSFQTLQGLLGQSNSLEITLGSETYNQISEDIEGFVDWNRITKEVYREISSDINLATVLYQQENPLQNFFTLEKVKLTLLNDEAIRLAYQINIPVTLRDISYNKEITHITHNFEMNFIRTPDLAAQLTAINQQVQAKLAGADFANQFEFISDSGDALKTAQFSQTNSNSNEVFNQLLTTLEPIGDNLAIDASKITLSSQSLAASITDRSSGWVGLLDWSQNSDVRVTQLKDYFIRNQISAEELAKIIAKNNSGYIAVSSPPGFPTIVDPTTSHSISVYGTLHGINRSTELKILLNQTGSQFKIDSTNSAEKRVIGVFGMKVNNFFVNYRNPSFPDKVIPFALPESYIFTRQKTSFTNTQELYNDFIKVSLEFNKQLYNLTTNSGDEVWRFNLPSNLPITDLKFNKKYLSSTYFDELIYEEIKKFKANHLDSKISDYINGYAGIGTQFEVNEQGYIRFYNNNQLQSNNSLAFFWINANSQGSSYGNVYGAKSYFGTVSNNSLTGPTKMQFILE